MNSMKKEKLKKKKVFIICSRSEYEFIWQHLPELIDKSKEELIIQYDFMEPEKIEEKIEKCTERIYKHTRIYSFSRTSAEENWYFKKRQHFETYVKDANKIILLTNNYMTADANDIEEKNYEEDFIRNLGIEMSEVNVEVLNPKRKVFKK